MGTEIMIPGFDYLGESGGMRLYWNPCTQQGAFIPDDGLGVARFQNLRDCWQTVKRSINQITEQRDALIELGHISSQAMKATIENVVRWHYYDLQRGNDSADPAHSGLDSDRLAELENCLDPSIFERLKQEGIRWAALELKRCGGIPWEEARKEIALLSEPPFATPDWADEA